MSENNREQTRVWRDVTLLTMVRGDVPYGMIEDGAIVARYGRIDWMGRARDLPALSGDVEVISGNGRFLTPGLIDCHTHLIYGGSRVAEFEQRLQGMSYGEIARTGGGILSTVRATRAAGEAELYDLGEKRLAQLQQGGVTTVEIKSGYGLDLTNEMKMLRVGRRLGENPHIDVVTTFLGAHMVAPEFGDDGDGYLDYVRTDMLDAVVRDNLADAVDAFCEDIAFTTDELEPLLARARELGLDIKLHAEQLTNSGGAALGAQYQALSADHLEYLDEDGVRAMAASGMVAVLLPGAFYSLGGGQAPPIELLRKYQVPMAIASDSNPGSSPVLSPQLMINMATTLFGLSPEEALAGMTRNGALALGLHDRGTLETGKKADFALWDITHPAELSYWLGGNACVGTVKDGELV